MQVKLTWKMRYADHNVEKNAGEIHTAKIYIKKKQVKFTWKKCRQNSHQKKAGEIHMKKNAGEIHMKKMQVNFIWKNAGEIHMKKLVGGGNAGEIHMKKLGWNSHEEIEIHIIELHMRAIGFTCMITCMSYDIWPLHFKMSLWCKESMQRLITTGGR